MRITNDTITYHPRVHEWRLHNHRGQLQATAGAAHLDRLTETWPEAIVIRTPIRYTSSINQMHIVHPPKGNPNMKLAVTKDQPFERAGRSGKPNPFMDEKTLETIKSGAVIRINVEKDERANTIINHLRKAAESVGMRVRVRYDDGVTKDQEKDVTTFRFQLVEKGDKKR